MHGSDVNYDLYLSHVEKGASYLRFNIARIFVPMFFMAVTSLTIGIIYSDESCDQNDTLSLSWWLRTYGGISVYFAIAYPTILVIITATHCEILIMEILLMGFAFGTIAWNVFGCTILLREGPEGSLSCYKDSPVLWYTTLIALVVQWYNFFVSCMVRLVKN